jgi:hypothetical protein
MPPPAYAVNPGSGTGSEGFDRFGKKYDKGGEWETFDKYLDYAKKNGHYGQFEEKYDFLRAKK